MSATILYEDTFGAVIDYPDDDYLEMRWYDATESLDGDALIIHTPARSRRCCWGSPPAASSATVSSPLGVEGWRCVESKGVRRPSVREASASSTKMWARVVTAIGMRGIGR
jgi:hypothetical protein